MIPATELTILLRSHIADLLNVDAKTVSDYIEDSKAGRLYADDPVPEPVGYLDSRAPDGWVKPEGRRPGLRPFWTRASIADWLAWRERHPAKTRKHAQGRN